MNINAGGIWWIRVCFVNTLCVKHFAQTKLLQWFRDKFSVLIERLVLVTLVRKYRFRRTKYLQILISRNRYSILRTPSWDSHISSDESLFIKCIFCYFRQDCETSDLGAFAEKGPLRKRMKLWMIEPIDFLNYQLTVEVLPAQHTT